MISWLKNVSSSLLSTCERWIIKLCRSGNETSDNRFVPPSNAVWSARNPWQKAYTKTQISFVRDVLSTAAWEMSGKLISPESEKVFLERASELREKNSINWRWLMETVFLRGMSFKMLKSWRFMCTVHHRIKSAKLTNCCFVLEPKTIYDLQLISDRQNPLIAESQADGFNELIKSIATSR